MGRAGVLRTRKDGGTSICTADEKDVGKRRCCHILDDASIKVKKKGATSYINISGKINGKDNSFDIQANETRVKDYISDLSKGLSEKDKSNILAVLREG